MGTHADCIDAAYKAHQSRLTRRDVYERPCCLITITAGDERPAGDPWAGPFINVAEKRPKAE